LNVTEFSDERSGARHELRDLAVLSSQPQARLALARCRYAIISNELHACPLIENQGVLIIGLKDNSVVADSETGSNSVFGTFRSQK
jgi:hypothetical protein